MDLELLRTFVEVERSRHFGHTAQRLHLTQAAVSARIRHLESIISAPLFARQRNNLQLTAAGRRLLPHAQATLDAWRSGQDAIADISSDSRLHLVAPGALLELYLNDVLAIMRTHMDHLRITVSVADNRTMLTQLLDRQVDLALTCTAPGSDDIGCDQVGELELVNVSRPGTASSMPAVGVDWGDGGSVSPECEVQLPSPADALRFIRQHGGHATLPRGCVTVSRNLVVNENPVATRTVYLARLVRAPGNTLIAEAYSSLVAGLSRGKNGGGTKAFRIRADTHLVP